MRRCPGTSALLRCPGTRTRSPKASCTPRASPDAWLQPWAEIEMVLCGNACVGLVTTVRSVNETLGAWCRYHLSVGFDFIFVYMDAPGEDVAAGAAARMCGERVCVIECPTSGREDLLLRLPAAAQRLGPHCQDEVMARQLVAAWHAIAVLAPKCGVDWLMHLDADELLDPGFGRRVGEVFWCLNIAGARCSTFKNWESIPEVDGASNPFAAHTLFKRPVASMPGGTCTSFWEERHETHKSYFLFYDNGKAGCRVEPGMRPMSLSWLYLSRY